MTQSLTDDVSSVDAVHRVRQWHAEQWAHVAMARATHEMAIGNLADAASWHRRAADAAPHAVEPLVFLASVLRALRSPAEDKAWKQLRGISPSSAELARSTVREVDAITGIRSDSGSSLSACGMIMVLGFRLDSDGTPSPRLLQRLDAAIGLSRRMPDAKILVSGGAVGGTEISEASVMARYLLECGVEPTRILEERHSLDTLENVEYARQFAVDEGLTSVILVSEEPHLTRAATLLELSRRFERSQRFSSSPGRAFTPVDLAATYRDALRLRGFRLHSERTTDMEDRMMDTRTIGDA